MNDPIDLYRQIRAAQKQVEQGGFADTALALAAVAEMIALEASVNVVPIERFMPGKASPARGALPIYRMARC